MSREKVEGPLNFSDGTSTGSSIPGVQKLAHNIAEASENGVLFFLAVEVQLLLADYIKKSGLPPTPVDLEILITHAAKTMIGK